jgi:O-antigen/teichoic acid export membrane protein
MIIYLIRRLGLSIPNFKHIKDYLFFGVPTIPSNLSSWIVNSSDRYIITLFLGINYVGYYNPAYVFGNILFMIAGLIGFVLPPTISTLYDDNKISELKNHLKYSMKYFFMISIPFLFGVTILSKDLLLFFTTSDISSKSYYIIPIVAASGLFYGIYTIYMHFLFAEKKTKIIGFIWIVAALLNLSLNLIFVKILGLLGAALTTLLAYGFAALIPYYFGIKHFSFNLDFKFLFKSLFSATIMTIYIILLESYLNLIILIGFGLIIYFVFMYILKGLEKEDLQMVINLIKPPKK